MNQESGGIPRQPDTYPVKRFYLLRKEDLTGMSGEGIVAFGVVLPSGKAILEWVTQLTSVALYDDLGSLEAIHGHEDRTKIVVIDE